METATEEQPKGMDGGQLSNIGTYLFPRGTLKYTAVCSVTNETRKKGVFLGLGIGSLKGVKTNNF